MRPDPSPVTRARRPMVLLAALAVFAAACTQGIVERATLVPAATPIGAPAPSPSVFAESRPTEGNPNSVSGRPATPSPSPIPTPVIVTATAPSPRQDAGSASPVTATVSPQIQGTARLEEPRVDLEPVANDLESPLFVTHAGDGSRRLFVLEKEGVVRIVSGGLGAPAPYLDLRDRVGSASSEQGLLGIAFAPDYRRSGYLFVNYTDRRGDTVVSRFVVSDDPNLARPDSELTLLSIDQPAPNHNGGMLAFGPDGYLYVGTGDGGAANDRFGNALNPASLLGKMLRVDITSLPGQPYRIPADNPWVESQWSGRDVRDEIWAMGLRNPWRFSFDRVTGDLWIADVGQNRYEEVNLVAAGSAGGLNFGWPIMEGKRCFPEDVECGTDGLQVPVLDYEHGANGCSITGGYVYRGRLNPGLVGAYLYADYCSGRIWGLKGSGTSRRAALLFESGLNISSFGEDEEGELYVTDLSGGGVYRIVVK